MTGLWVPKTAHVMAYTKVGSAHGAGDCRFESCRGQFGNAVAMLLRYVLVSALCCLEPPILPTHGAPVYSRAYVPFSLVRRVAGPSPDCTGCRWWSSATRTRGLLLVGARRTNVCDNRPLGPGDTPREGRHEGRTLRSRLQSRDWRQAEAEASRSCVPWLRRRLLRRYRPQSAASCSTL